MENGKWGIGAKLWFGLMILGQWLMFIEYATKPITRYNSDYQHMTLVWFFVGAIGTIIYLWLAIGKSKAALSTIIIMGIINALVSLVQGGPGSAILPLIAPTITWLIARGKVGDEACDDGTV